jgi:hypothetical protein
MAARARRGAAAGAAQPPTAGEGGGWLCRVYGRSPAEGDLAVYALLPRLPAPGSLGRLAAVLSADLGFEAREAVAERLPFPARGYAVVNPKSGDVTPAVPEETLRALEEYRSRKMGIVVEAWPLDLPKLAEFLAEARRLGATARIRSAFDVLHVFELRFQRPPSRWELEGLLQRAHAVGAFFSGEARRQTLEAERKLLERAGLWALAWMAPELVSRELLSGGCCYTELGESDVRISTVLAPPLGRLLPRRGGGRRGRYSLSRGEFGASLDISLLEVGDRDLGPLEELLEADEASTRWMRELADALREIERAEERVEERLGGAGLRAPLASRVLLSIENPRRARVWEGGGRVRLWLAPEERARLLEELTRKLRPLGLALGDYLRAVSEELGKEVELVEGEAPLPPELAAAAERARRALAELVGSGSS